MYFVYDSYNNNNSPINGFKPALILKLDNYHHLLLVIGQFGLSHVIVTVGCSADDKIINLDQ